MSQDTRWTYKNQVASISKWTSGQRKEKYDFIYNLF